ncbi:hypothetical protein OSSY52_19590 [Tepiditoga spiralis]|uniref:histidine kinase n=1 Tax=Tepiditoga spiralis TaxID=2108365 RepID=A0A7G1G5G8_9BACT|nr:HAMP domain-containing sensor histidine kinase [Tepiditoga spiralis]BBE31818.1 hypothetical protein OSSY52_19590 [Tepiditoga spiralis]
MKLKTKNFLLINFLLIFIFFSIYFFINIFLEKYYIYEKTKKSINILNELIKDEKKSEILSDSETTINIFEYVDNEDLFNDRLRLGFHDKKLFLVKIWVIQKNIDKIKNGETYIQYYKQPKLKTTTIITIKLYKNKVISVAVSLASMKDTISLFNKFYLFALIITLILSSIGINIYTNNLVNKIQKIKNAAKKISNLNFSEKIKLNTNDELQELSESINSLSKKLEVSINKLKKQINYHEVLNEKQQNFISNAGHELKTPVTIIEGYAHAIKDNIKNDKKRTFYSEIIVEESEKLKDIINTFLDFSSINNDEIIFYHFNIYEVILNVIKKYSLDLEEKNIQINLLIDKGTVVYGNPKKLEQVFDNLLSNALSFTNNVITISTKKQNNKIMFFIFNDGEQIPVEKINDIWTPFYKIKTLKNRKYGGTGLGLSIVAEILKKHNSNFGVNNLNNGVEFYFSLYT